MFGTIQFLVYLRYLNLNKQLISIRDSHRVQLSDSVLYLPCYFHILLAVISEIVSHRAQIIFISDQEVMHVVHDMKFVVHVFLSGCCFHLYMDTYRSRLISTECDKIISFLLQRCGVQMT